MVERLFTRAKGASLKAQLARYLNPLPCKICGGRRLKPEVLAVKLKSEIRNQKSEIGIQEFTLLPVREAMAWARGVSRNLGQRALSGGQGAGAARGLCQRVGRTSRSIARTMPQTGLELYGASHRFWIGAASARFA